MGRQAPTFRRQGLRSLPLQFLEPGRIVVLFSEPSSEFLDFRPRPVRGHCGVGTESSPEHSCSHNRSVAPRSYFQGHTQAQSRQARPPAAGPVRLPLSTQAKGSRHRATASGHPRPAWRGSPEHSKEAQSDTRRIHQGDPALPWNKQMQGLGAMVRLGVVLLRCPST